MKTGPKPQPVPERFWAKVGKLGPDECWLWSGSLNLKGYGYLVVGSRTNGRSNMLAHRLSYEIHNGSIPTGSLICHKCDVPACVNPAHLFMGTQKDNMSDALRKGRMYFHNEHKTHCHKGHPFSEQNTQITNGTRVCALCNRARVHAHYERHKERIKAQRRADYQARKFDTQTSDARRS